MSPTGTWLIGGLTKNSKRREHPIRLPYLRVANVYTNRLDLSEVKEIGLKESEIERVLLKRNDLLIVEGNGSPTQIGRVALWDGSIENCVHQNHLIKVRFDKPILARYVCQWLLSANARENILDVASTTSGLYTLSLGKVRNLPVPISPEEEQIVILEKLDSILSNVNHIQAENYRLFKKSVNLRNSILKKAFEGRLVPQDPDDESASVLLERIKAQRMSK